MTLRDETIERLTARIPELRRDWSRPKPFPYVVIDDFLSPSAARALLESYPETGAPGWMGKTYAHQSNKFRMVSGFPEPIAEFFALTADTGFRDLVSQITGIPKLLDDTELEGGGLHLITRGGFLDIHVDFNFHPQTKLHRRLNLLLYLNKEWDEAFGGHLELWDMSTRRRIERVAPLLNRCVIFATNEVSYHGHPHPLECPENVARKSLAVYYFTETRDDILPAAEHNTMYRQTTGAVGYLKTAASSARALRERLRNEGSLRVAVSIADKGYRKLRGLPPRNG